MTKQLTKNYTKDFFSNHLNIEVLTAAKHYGKIQMPLNTIQKNAMNMAHGGAIFSLADMAFAVAANYEESYAMLSASASISYLKQGKKGPLIAEGRLIHGGNKLAVYEVRVIDGDNELIAIVIMNGYRTKIPIQTL